MSSHKRWQRGRLTVGWHAYTQHRWGWGRQLVVQPFLFWGLR